MKRIYPPFKNSQKIRVILNGVGFYTTISETQSMFATTQHYQAVNHCLREISTQGGHIKGIGTRYNQIDVQVDICQD